MGDETASVGREWFEAWNERDFDRGAALVTADADLVEVPTGETFRGPEGSREEAKKWAEALPDGRVEVRQAIGAANAAVLECRIRGTNTGPFATPTGDVPATGREVDFEFCTILQIEAGKITGVRHYYDVATIMRQLGLMPETAGATA